jgi:hypothetical protein
LDASHNRLRALDVTGCSLLYLQVEQNRLLSLDLKGQRELEYVNANGNQLDQFEIPHTSTLRYVLLGGNEEFMDYLQHQPEFSTVQFTDSHPAARNSFQWYFFKAMKEVAEEERICRASGSDYHFCADMMKMRLYDLLRKYDRKRRLYRYEKGMMVLTFPVICMLNLLYQEESHPEYDESQFDYSVTKRMYYQEASMWDMDDFPAELVLIVKGREIIFDSDEVAFTSVNGFPEELGYVRYIERITGKKRAQRSMVIWND